MISSLSRLRGKMWLISLLLSMCVFSFIGMGSPYFWNVLFVVLSIPLVQYFSKFKSVCKWKTAISTICWVILGLQLADVVTSPTLRKPTRAWIISTEPFNYSHVINNTLDLTRLLQAHEDRLYFVSIPFGSSYAFIGDSKVQQFHVLLGVGDNITHAHHGTKTYGHSIFLATGLNQVLHVLNSWVIPDCNDDSAPYVTFDVSQFVITPLQPLQPSILQPSITCVSIDIKTSGSGYAIRKRTYAWFQQPMYWAESFNIYMLELVEILDCIPQLQPFIWQLQFSGQCSLGAMFMSFMVLCLVTTYLVWFFSWWDSCTVRFSTFLRQFSTRASRTPKFH